MIKFTGIAFLLLWVVFTLSFQSCMPLDTSKEEALIIHRFLDGPLGSSKYPVFHESVSQEELLKWVQIPLEKKRLVRSAVVEPQQLDLLLTSEALKNWTNQILDYESVEWEQIDSVSFNTIQIEEIPSYIRDGGLPGPNEDAIVVGVLYISKPFVYENMALLYVRRFGSTGVLWFFKKENDSWKRVTYSNLSTD